MMSANAGVLRRSYDYVAMFALIHVLVAMGAGAYLLGSGRITPDELQQIAAVLRGDQTDEASAEEQASRVTQATSIAQAKLAPERLAEESEMIRLEAQRIKAELDQRLTLNNNIMLRVTTKREAFEAERRRAEEVSRHSLDQQQEEGFRKQVAIFEALSPKTAIEHLLNLESSDEAARMLLEMDTRKAKKIVEAAKSGDQLRRMQIILQRLRDVAPDRSVEFDRNEGSP